MRTIRIPFGRTGAAIGAAVMLAGGLAACGGGGSTPATTSAAVAGQGSPSGSRSGRGAFDPVQQQKITQCLEAAGIAVPSFSGRPSGFPSGERPSGSPTRTRTRPSGSGVGGRFADPKVRAALEACGIELPSGRPGGGQGGGAGTTSPSATG